MNARDEGRVLVVCKDSSTLDVVDLHSWEVIGSIAASGYTPHEVTASPDGRVGYLPIFSDVGVGDPGTDGRAIDVVDLVNLTSRAPSRCLSQRVRISPWSGRMGCCT